MGEGEGGMIWENGIETCIISYIKRIASPGSMHDTGCSGLVHWDQCTIYCRDFLSDRGEKSRRVRLLQLESCVRIGIRETSWEVKWLIEEWQLWKASTV